MTELDLSKRNGAREVQQIDRPDSLIALALRSFAHHRSGMVGLLIILVMAGVALAAPILAPYDPLEMHAEARFSPPSLTYPMGTDEFGRDILSRIIYGSRIAFGVGLTSVGIATIIGVTTGLIAGYAEGAFDAVIMRFFDAVLAFPAILLAIIILAVLGPGALNAILAIAIVNIPAFARLARANMLVEKNKDYVDAAKAIGSKPTRIVFRNIFPNTVSTILVLITVSVASAVLLESALSFLGLGTPLPAPSWGSMLSIGRGYLYMAPWYGIFPGLAIALLVMGFYLLGDGLRDALDPRRR